MTARVAQTYSAERDIAAAEAELGYRLTLDTYRYRDGQWSSESVARLARRMGWTWERAKHALAHVHEEVES
jgi:hypothetical protein